MTMRDLAAAMDCEVANLYNYIESKDWILQTFLFELSNEFHNGIDAIRSSELNDIEKIKSIVRLHVQISLADPAKASLLVNEWRHLKPSLLERFVKERQAYERKVRSVVKNLLSESRSNIDLNLATQSFLASLRWIFDWRKSSKKKHNAIEIERQLSSLVLYGLTGKGE